MGDLSAVRREHAAAEFVRREHIDPQDRLREFVTGKKQARPDGNAGLKGSCGGKRPALVGDKESVATGHQTAAAGAELIHFGEIAEERRARRHKAGRVGEGKFRESGDEVGIAAGRARRRIHATARRPSAEGQAIGRNSGEKRSDHGCRRTHGRGVAHDQGINARPFHRDVDRVASVAGGSLHRHPAGGFLVPPGKDGRFIGRNRAPGFDGRRGDAGLRQIHVHPERLQRAPAHGQKPGQSLAAQRRQRHWRFGDKAAGFECHRDAGGRIRHRTAGSDSDDDGVRRLRGQTRSGNKHDRVCPRRKDAPGSQMVRLGEFPCGCFTGEGDEPGAGLGGEPVCIHHSHPLRRHASEGDTRLIDGPGEDKRAEGWAAAEDFGCDHRRTRAEGKREGPGPGCLARSQKSILSQSRQVVIGFTGGTSIDAVGTDGSGRSRDSIDRKDDGAIEITGALVADGHFEIPDVGGAIVAHRLEEDVGLGREILQTQSGPLKREAPVLGHGRRGKKDGCGKSQTAPNHRLEE